MSGKCIVSVYCIIKVKPETLDDETKDFLPSLPTHYKATTRYVVESFNYLLTVFLGVVVKTCWFNLAID